MLELAYIFKRILGKASASRRHKKSWIPIDKHHMVQDKSPKKFRRVIRMLVVIILVFAICWTPYLTFLLLQGFGIVPIQLDGILKLTKTAFILMAYMNRSHGVMYNGRKENLSTFFFFFSALNPIIYGFMSKNFRTSFRKAMCNCLGQEERATTRTVAWDHDNSVKMEDGQAQLCCNHKDLIQANKHGLRINRSKGTSSRYVVHCSQLELDTN